MLAVCGNCLGAGAAVATVLACGVYLRNRRRRLRRRCRLLALATGGAALSMVRVITTGTGRNVLTWSSRSDGFPSSLPLILTQFPTEASRCSLVPPTPSSSIVSALVALHFAFGHVRDDVGRRISEHVT